MTAAHTPIVRKSLSGRSEAIFTVTGNYIPDRLDDVVIYKADGTTPAFGGVVLTRRVYPVVSGRTAHYFCEVVCVDHLALAEEVQVSRSYADPVAPEDVLDDLVTDYLTPWGFSFTPVATGKLLAPFEWQHVKLADALRRLMEASGLIVRASPTKVLSLFEPGTEPGPWSITDANMHSSTFEWEDPPDLPATRIVARCGPQGVARATQRWIADGVATSWVTDIPAVGPPALVLVDDGVTPFLATVGDGAMFEWSATDHAPFGTLKVGTYGTPANGVKLVVGPKLAAGDPLETDGFLAAFPFDVVADSGASPPIERVVALPDVISPAEGRAIADRLLAGEQAGVPPARVLTHEGDDFEPGQTLPIAISAFGGINDTFLVEAVETHLRQVNGQVLRMTTLTLNDSARTRSGPGDEWRGLLTASGSTPSLVLSTGGGSAGTTTVMPWVFLGGSLATAVQVATAGTYVPVADAVDFVAPATGTVRLRAQIRAAVGGVTVKARLIHVGGSGHSAESSGVTGTTAGEVTVVTAVTAGERYRLSVTTDTNGAWAFGLGSLEAI